MLDLASMTWETEGKPPTLTYELCNNLCDDIESVPYHKVTWPITVLLPALRDVPLACQCCTSCTDRFNNVHSRYRCLLLVARGGQWTSRMLSRSWTVACSSGTRQT